MSECISKSENDDFECHVPFHRVWMDYEYDILTKEQLERQKKRWNNETIS